MSYSGKRTEGGLFVAEATCNPPDADVAGENVNVGRALLLWEEVGLPMSLLLLVGGVFV